MGVSSEVVAVEGGDWFTDDVSMLSSTRYEVREKTRVADRADGVKYRRCRRNKSSEGELRR